jgi:hypothetical protein
MIADAADGADSIFESPMKNTSCWPGKQGICACFEQKMRSLRPDLKPVQALTAEFPVFLGTGNVAKQNRE